MSTHQEERDEVLCIIFKAFSHLLALHQCTSDDDVEAKQQVEKDYGEENLPMLFRCKNGYVNGNVITAHG